MCGKNKGMPGPGIIHHPVIESESILVGGGIGRLIGRVKRSVIVKHVIVVEIDPLVENDVEREERRMRVFEVLDKTGRKCFVRVGVIVRSRRGCLMLTKALRSPGRLAGGLDGRHDQPTGIAMIAMTTRSSISVKAGRFRRRVPERPGANKSALFITILLRLDVV